MSDQPDRGVDVTLGQQRREAQIMEARALLATTIAALREHGIGPLTLAVALLEAAAFAGSQNARLPIPEADAHTWKLLEEALNITWAGEMSADVTPMDRAVSAATLTLHTTRTN